ncbi:unnamed protein product [Anisakis simplex]|uniref:tRNA-intron lyase n=1 Tax=Anisakis simplex TaxID=6269 RepID=A0A0M3KD58_ANISI|nr:unnamed protein product [Anisakis simplex]
MDLLYFDRKRGVPAGYRKPLSIPSGRFSAKLIAGEVIVEDPREADDLNTMGYYGNFIERRQTTVTPECFGLNSRVFQEVDRPKASGDRNRPSSSKLDSGRKRVRLAALEKVTEMQESKLKSALPETIEETSVDLTSADNSSKPSNGSIATQSQPVLMVDSEAAGTSKLDVDEMSDLPEDSLEETRAVRKNTSETTVKSELRSNSTLEPESKKQKLSTGESDAVRTNSTEENASVKENLKEEPSTLPISDSDKKLDSQEVEGLTVLDMERLKKMESWANIVCMDQRLRLSMEEAMYLAYDLAVLEVSHQNIPLSIDQLWQRFYKIAGLEFVKRYATYRFLRGLGWVVRSGLTLGCAFVLYCDGPDYHHSSGAVQIVDSSQSMAAASSAQCFAALNRSLYGQRKSLIQVQVDIPMGLSLSEHAGCIERIRVQHTTFATCGIRNLQSR